MPSSSKNHDTVIPPMWARIVIHEDKVSINKTACCFVFKKNLDSHYYLTSFCCKDLDVICCDELRERWLLLFQ